MFKLSSRVSGGVGFDGVDIIKRADQTVDAIGNVNCADGSGVTPRVRLSSGLPSCYQVGRVIS